MKLDVKKAVLSDDKEELFIEMPGRNLLTDMRKVFVETNDQLKVFYEREEDDLK